MGASCVISWILGNRRKSMFCTLLLAPLLVGSVSAPLASRPASTQSATSTLERPSALQVSADIVHCPDLSYSQTDTGTLQLDLVMPGDGAGPFPTVVIIHAIGPWAKDRKAYLPQANEFAREGYVGVVISYSHLPEIAYPKAIEDTEAAIRWLRTNAGKYKIDSNRIAAMGYSGGGALACLLGMNRADEKPTQPSCRVEAVVAYYPPSDFTRLHRDCGNGKIPFPQCFMIASGFEAWLGGTPSKAPEKYSLASPINHIHNEMAPILLIHGMKDSVVPIDQSQTFADRIAAKQGRVTLVALSGAEHGFDEESGANTEIAKQSARTFLHGQLSRPRTSLLALQR
jgi:acetyl esterase/lipase